MFVALSAIDGALLLENHESRLQKAIGAAVKKSNCYRSRIFRLSFFNFPPSPLHMNEPFSRPSTMTSNATLICQTMRAEELAASQAAGTSAAATRCSSSAQSRIPPASAGPTPSESQPTYVMYKYRLRSSFFFFFFFGGGGLVFEQS